MATFLDLYGDLLDRELGSDDRTQLFTTSRRKTAINEAQQQFALLTECFTIQHTTGALADNLLETDLDVTSIAGFVAVPKQGLELKKTVGTVVTQVAGDDFVRRDIPWLNRFRPGWRTESKGTPDTWYVREDGGQILVGLLPPLKVSAGETWVMIIPYVALPTDLTGDADQPFSVLGNAKTALLPWHPALPKYAAYLLEQYRKNYQVGATRLAEFNRYIADYLQRQRPRGGGHVVYARSYRGEVRSSQRPPDPRT